MVSLELIKEEAAAHEADVSRENMSEPQDDQQQNQDDDQKQG